MKAGTSFGSTLAHFANASLPELAHIPSCNGKIADEFEDSCKDQDAPKNRRGVWDFFLYKYPMPQWFPGVFWIPETCDFPACHGWVREEDWDQWQGHFVALFRDPRARVASAYNHFVMHNINHTMVKHSNSSMIQHFLKIFAQVAQGTTTTMLSGKQHPSPQWCEFNFAEAVANDTRCRGKCRTCVERTPSARDLQVAVERLRKGFAFVGLTEHFDLSVCLFHAMFGGDCRSVELANMRKGKYKEDYDGILKDAGFLVDTNCHQH